MQQHPTFFHQPKAVSATVVVIIHTLAYTHAPIYCKCSTQLPIYLHTAQAAGHQWCEACTPMHVTCHVSIHMHCCMWHIMPAKVASATSRSHFPVVMSGSHLAVVISRSHKQHMDVAWCHQAPVNVKSLVNGRCSVVGPWSQAGLQSAAAHHRKKSSSYVCMAVKGGSAAPHTDTATPSETLQSKEEAHQARNEHGVFVATELGVPKHSVHKHNGDLCYGCTRSCGSCNHLHLECVALGCD